jgi:hypothetical protein
MYAEELQGIEERSTLLSFPLGLSETPIEALQHTIRLAAPPVGSDSMEYLPLVIPSDFSATELVGFLPVAIPDQNFPEQITTSQWPQPAFRQ